MTLFPWKKKKHEKIQLHPTYESESNVKRDFISATAPRSTLQPTSEPDASEQRGETRLLSYQVANLQGLGTCERQEDSFSFTNALDVTMIRERGLFAVVADGMGGMKDGREASEAVISGLKAGFCDFDYQVDIVKQLYDCVMSANESVFHMLDGEGGSTVVACVLYRENLYYASVGDSYLYLKRNGLLIRLNRPQNVLNELYLQSIRAGNIDPRKAEQNREKAALTHFLGMEELDDIDFLRTPLPLKNGDVLLICSDGVAGMLTEEQIMKCLMEAEPQRMCDAIEQEIGRRPTGQYQDNYTALIIQCGY